MSRRLASFAHFAQIALALFVWALIGAAADPAHAQDLMNVAVPAAAQEAAGTAPEHVPRLKASDIVVSADDRENATPAGNWIYYGQSDADVNATAANLNARVVDIQLEAVTLPRRFTVSYVSNTGAYAKSWWWYYDVDATTLGTLFTNNNARPIVLKPYDIGGGQLRFAVVMISNTGADAKTWYWYYNDTTADIASQLSLNNARLVQIGSYVISGVLRYAVVMIPNTGADARSWWWYYNVSTASLAGFLATNQARLLDLDRDPTTGNYNAIMIACSANCPLWWWYYGSSAQGVLDTMAQNGARAIDLNSYPGCGSLCFSYVLINNSNDITSRVGELLRNGTDGTKGLYLKEVGGPVLANLEENWVFEPASAIKAVLHVYAMHQVQTGASNLTDFVNKYLPPTSGSCPGNTVSGTETLSTALGEMMRHSDNTRTRQINDTYGTTNIINYAAGFGMTNTHINHVIGCGGPIPNQTTLTDLATLYEGVANGTLLNATNRATFYGLMAGKAEFLLEGYDWTALWSTDITAIINQEAPAGMLAGTKAVFREWMNVAYKAGNYKICGSSCSTYIDHVDISGWAQIPFCSGGNFIAKQYVFGMFINNSTSDATSNATFTATKSELLREQIRAGLASCANANGTVDVDGNAKYDALTDGLLLIRYLFGITGPSLTAGAVGSSPSRSTPAAIVQYLDNIRPLLDVDGNGHADALTDGLMLLRYLFGLRGPTLINGAIGPGATRTAAADIAAHIQLIMP